MINYFQILDCSNDLGNCCSDYGLANILDTLRKILELLQIIVPILLIVMATVQFTKLVASPDAKDGVKSLINKFMAASICFFIPTFVNFVLTVIPSSGIVPKTFQVSACWQKAKTSNALIKSTAFKYVSYDGLDTIKDTPISSSKRGKNKSSSSKGDRNGSEKGKAIVSYAESFVGNKYLYGGNWNGEKPYSPTDCSGFVQGVFKHNGITGLPRATSSYDVNSSMFTKIDSNNIQAGDLVLYNGHIAILTGNGEEIVHAAGDKWGIIKQSTYKYQAVKAILRVKGV